MKTFFRPLYLFIAATVIVFALLVTFVIIENSASVVTNKMYVVGYDNDFAGQDVGGKERELSTFFDELLEKVGDIKNISITTDIEPYENLFPALKRGAVDAVGTVTLPNEIFAVGRYGLSEPIYDFGPVIVVRADSKVTKLEDLKGMVIGITRGSNLASELSLDPSIFVVAYNGVLSALDHLQDKSIEAALLPFVPAYVYAHSLFRGKMRIASTPLIHAYLHLVVLSSRSGLRLLHDFNEVLKKMKEDGSYDALLQRWNLPNPDKPEFPSEQAEPEPHVHSSAT